jgi:hypothetical protein
MEDMAEWVEDLEIPLEPGMTVDEPDEVEVVWLVVLLNGLESSASWVGRLIAGTAFEVCLAVFDLGSPRPKPELSLSDVSVTDIRRRWDGLRGGPDGDGGTEREVFDDPETLLVEGVRYPREGSCGRRGVWGTNVISRSEYAFFSDVGIRWRREGVAGHSRASISSLASVGGYSWLSADDEVEVEEPEVFLWGGARLCSGRR